MFTTSVLPNALTLSELNAGTILENIRLGYAIFYEQHHRPSNFSE